MCANDTATGMKLSWCRCQHPRVKKKDRSRTTSSRYI